MEGIAVAAIYPSLILIMPVRYAVNSHHIRIIQLSSALELLEKYKSVSKQQRDGRTISSASSRGIKINFTK